MFGRAGTALVTGIGYLVVLRSYTSFEVTVEGRAEAEPGDAPPRPFA
ncbi:MAG: hypothetical protein OXP69_06465 [Spirochaetaceae bacterium]|nr:hypothetical protein [Spirochaetaceae bacterium]